MAELSAVPFNALPSAHDGYTVLYDNDKVCRSDVKLSELVGDISSYLTKEQADTLYQEKGDYLSASTSAKFYPMTGNPSGFLTAHQSLDEYATQEWVENQGYLTEHQPISADEWNSCYETVSANSGIWGSETYWYDDITAASANAYNSAVNWVINQNYLTGVDLSNYYTKPEIDSRFGFRDFDVEVDADVEPREIWIAFKFHDKNYNPQEHNLAIGTVESNGEDRPFKADWQLVDAEENVWMWGVTEGTNLDSAFRYGAGESSFPLLVGENYRDIPEEMWRQEGYNSLEEILAACDSWWVDYVREGTVQYTGAVEIYDWDLSQATSLDYLFGGNTYWRTSLIGTIPELNSNARHAVYMFGRLYDITTVGKITLQNINGDIQKLMFAMTSLQEIPELDFDGTPQDLDMLFWEDCNVSKESIEDAYYYLNELYGNLSHHNTFKQSGLYKDPTALDKVPESWGGNLV